MRVTVNEILKAAGARLPVGTPDAEVVGASVDSRDITPGSLFVGIRGEFTDVFRDCRCIGDENVDQHNRT